MEAFSLKAVHSGTYAVIIAAAVLQIIILGSWHRIRPWTRVLIRTLIVQVLACLAGTVLLQRWPFDIPTVYAGIQLPYVISELLIMVWYLVQPRTNQTLEIDGDTY